MKIGIDLDEVLGEFLNAMLLYHNEKYGTSFERNEFRTYNYCDTRGGTMEEAIQKVCDFHKTSYFKNIQPVVGAQEGINTLTQNHDLFVITARQDGIASETHDWINQYFPNAFSEIILTNHYSQNGDSRTKKQVCESLGIDIFIDDSVGHVLDCSSPTRKTFLFDRPWNQQSTLPQEIQRVGSWEDFLKVVR